MNRKLDRLIPLALEAAKEILAGGGDTISSEYNGYIASFGASVIQAGLKPAVAFNERSDSQSAKDKAILMKTLLYMVKKQNGEDFDADNPDEKLLSYVLEKGDQDNRLKRQILDSATALKLAIRTFKLVKKG